MLLYVFTAAVKSESFPKFRKSAGDIEKRLASVAPRGWRLRGIYLTSFGLGKNQLELHWDVDSFSAFDGAHQEHAAGGDFTKAIDDIYSHLELSTQRARVLRPLAAANAGAAAQSLSF